MKTREESMKMIRKVIDRANESRDWYVQNFGIAEFNCACAEWGKFLRLDRDSVSFPGIGKIRPSAATDEPGWADTLLDSLDGFPAFLADRAKRRKEIDRIHEAGAAWLERNPWPLSDSLDESTSQKNDCEDFTDSIYHGIGLLIADNEEKPSSSKKNNIVPLRSLEPGDHFKLAKDTKSPQIFHHGGQIFPKGRKFTLLRIVGGLTFVGYADCADSMTGTPVIFPPDTPVIQIG